MSSVMKVLKLFVPVIVALVVYVLPTPEGLSNASWLYFSIFLGVVVGLILEPIPAALVGLVGVGVCIWLKVGPVGSGVDGAQIASKVAVSWGLAGFSNSTVWLIFAAFMIGLGYQRSGLGKRIALFLVKTLGKTTLGLGYAISIADLILAPFIPSNSARSGGTLYPIVNSIPPMMGSYPDKEPRKVGAYLVWVSLAATCVTSSMFFTALAPNLLAMETAVKSGVEPISWFGWFMAFLPAGIILFLLTPFLTYILYPPTLKGSSEAQKWAQEELGKIGKMSIKEWLMIALAVFALVFWIGGDTFGVDATTVALSVMIGMVLLGIISWDDVLGNKSAWSVLAWFGSLVTLAGGLKNVGFLEFIAKIGGEYLGHFDALTAMIGLIVLFYLLHYFFASTTSHVTALLALFITVAMGIDGIDVRELTLFLMLSLGIMGIITPYGTGPSPVWFGSGFVSGKDFWRLGFIFGMLYLVVFLVITIPWVRYVAHAWL
ncbi:anion permease [Helicobacter sp. MIT 99-10781]|uniref:anion permease n=1 Tax=Helicobacter sp. MIT 99-10781 TaxID=1332285 RepID=UPI0026CBB37C